MLNKGDVHFAVDYAPAAKFETVDDANDGMHTDIFDRFDDAAAFAKNKAASDFFHKAMISARTAFEAFQPYIQGEREKVRDGIAEYYDSTARTMRRGFVFVSVGESKADFEVSASHLEATAEAIRALPIGGSGGGDG